MNSLTKKGDFVKNAIILISGTGVAQAIPLIFSPILTRIFSPIDFGRLAFFMALCAILSIMSTGLYELSIMEPRKNNSAFNILVLVIGMSFIISILILLFLIFFGSFVGHLLNSPVQYEYLLLIPIGIFFTGSFQGLNYWLNRRKQYKVINFSRVMQSVVTVVVSIVLGYLGLKSYGLIIGFIAGCIVSTIPLVFILFKKRSLISKSAVTYSLKKYIEYPKFMMPSSILNTTASQTPIFFINKFFSPAVVGDYSFASRILTAPIGIISGAIGQIYFQKVSEISRRGTSNIFDVLKRTAKTLSGISIIIFLPFFFFGEEIFKFVFGINWANAGKYVEIISIGAFIKFVVSPLSTVFFSTNNLRIVASWQTTYFLTSITLFFLCRHMIFLNLLWIYVSHEVVLYSIYFSLMVYVSKKFDERKPAKNGI
jgi:teichuronic acid exporter